MIMTVALVSLALTVAFLPPKWDPAILLKEYQMGHVPPNKFFRGLKNAILPALALWAVVAFIVWITFFS